MATTTVSSARPMTKADKWLHYFLKFPENGDRDLFKNMTQKKK